MDDVVIEDFPITSFNLLMSQNGQPRPLRINCSGDEVAKMARRAFKILLQDLLSVPDQFGDNKLKS